MRVSNPAVLLRLSASVLPVSLLLVSGCAHVNAYDPDRDIVPAGVERSYRDENLNREQIERGGIALAGVVIRQGVRVQRSPDLPPLEEEFGLAEQTDFWRLACEQRFNRMAGAVPLTPHLRFADLVEDRLKLELWNDYAEGGGISPALLDSIRAADPRVRYLLMVRVDFEDVRQDIQTGAISSLGGMNPTARRTTQAHDPSRQPNSMLPTIKRTVGLTVGMFDLETARCVWEMGTVEAVKRPASKEALADYAGIVARATEAGDAAIVQNEKYPGAPPFGDVLDKCLGVICRAMSRDLFPVRVDPDPLFE